MLVYTITLREATQADIPELVRLEQLVSGSRIYSAMLTEVEWIEALQKEKVFRIESNGHIVGNLSYEYKNPQHVHISGIVIDPKYQGHGIAKRVLADLITRLSGVHVHRIDLVTHPHNERALSLYEKLGFHIESQVENYYGDGEPRVILVKTM